MKWERYLLILFVETDFKTNYILMHRQGSLRIQIPRKEIKSSDDIDMLTYVPWESQLGICVINELVLQH